MARGGTEADQQPHLWDNHVSVYEAVFQPFSLAFAGIAIEALGLVAGQKVLDVGAGSGGSALALARAGCRVAAIDASAQMVERTMRRAGSLGSTVDARVMDGQALAFADATFDAALSVFGVILFADAVQGLSEMRRVVRPGGKVAIVTWTEPQNYELASELRAAAMSVLSDVPAAPLPAQLRYREEADFAALFRSADFASPVIAVHTATLRAPSARWLGARLAFAPGMAAQLASFGPRAGEIVAAFVSRIEARQGAGAIRLSGRAFVGTAAVT